MTEFLSKIFIKDHKNYNDNTVRKKYGTLSSSVGIFINLVLATIKIIGGVLSSSVALTADAFNNLSDAGTATITLISFKLSSKPADKKHPFGHARIEYIASMIVSFVILLVGFELFSESVKILLDSSKGKDTFFDTVTFVILCISLILKLWLGLFYRKIGKRIDSKIIAASSLDSVTDSISTGAVLVSSIIIKYTGLTFIDAIVGVCVSVIIFISGAKILNDMKNVLLGEAPIKEVVESIREVVAKYADVIEIHDLLIHNYGPGHCIASFHAEMDGAKDIYALHDTIDDIEREIKKSLGITCTIHLDPIVKNDEEVKEHERIVLSVLEELGIPCRIHDFRVVEGKTHTKLLFDVVVPYEINISEENLVEEIIAGVNMKAPNHFCVITVDRE